MKNLIYLSLFVALLFVSSCGKEEDNTAPTINLIEPEDGEVFEVGEEIHLDAEIKDDVELSQLKISIHENFDGHDHNKNSVPLFENIIRELTGKEADEHFHIAIPNNTSTGPYHLTAEVLDKAGNKSNVVERGIYITGSSQPIIDISEPNMEGEVDLHHGESLQLVGTVQDEDGLDEVHITVKPDHSHKKETLKFEFEKELGAAKSFDFSEVPAISNTDWEDGHYELRIFVKDINGNVAVKVAEIHVD